jgi:hypothetical protein
MAHCLEVSAWRTATSEELIAFHKGKLGRRKSPSSLLVVRKRLTQADMYAYLRARFGMPNGFQNYLRKDDSDNLVHWDFNLRAAEVDVYIEGRMRDIVILVSEPRSDENWKALILAIKADFGRLGQQKSQMLKSFEKFVIFQNKFSTLANLCGELHASIVDAPPPIRALPRIKSKQSIRHVKSAMDKIAKRATNLYGDCLKLRLLTPIMAEAFLNMMILAFCKPEIRDNSVLYGAFVREKIPQRLKLLSENCFGFARSVDPSSDTYTDFLRVMNARNFAIHGNVDPIREHIETVYFEGKRPLFADNGDHLLKLFEHLELINAPRDVVKDYETVHLFLVELQNLLSPKFRDFFGHVIDDPYPGFELKVKRVTKILPSHTAAMMFPNERRDDELEVTW